MELPILSVNGVDVRLSTYDNTQIKMEGGHVRVSLSNYSGDLIFMTSGSTGGGQKRKAAEAEAVLDVRATPTPTCRWPSCHGRASRSDALPFALPFRAEATLALPRPCLSSLASSISDFARCAAQVGDEPSELLTMKKSQKSEFRGHSSRNPASDFAMPSLGGETVARGSMSEGNFELHALLAEAGGFAIIDGEGNGDGLFHFLGGGKSPAKSGLVTVTASGYDPSKKKPEDLVAGRKGGQGVEALAGEDDQIWIQFGLRKDMEFAPSGYSLRNGSRDMGQFPKQWVFECLVGSRWVQFAEEDSDALDGIKQAPERFSMSEEYAISADVFVSKMRIRHTGDAESERHKLWFASVELYGTLRVVD